MFMRFRGGGVGHLGTRYLNPRLEADNHDLGGEQQDEVTLTSMQVDRDPNPDEEPGDGAMEDQGTYKEFTSRSEPRNEEDEEDEDEDEGENEDGSDDTDSEHEVLMDTDDEQDLDDEDDGILDAEGFAEL
jgi:hypothetical protein